MTTSTYLTLTVKYQKQKFDVEKSHFKRGKIIYSFPKTWQESKARTTFRLSKAQPPPAPKTALGHVDPMMTYHRGGPVNSAKRKTL
jgi:hypothetical protein